MLRLILLTLFVLLVGTPHVGWAYECRHSMRGEKRGFVAIDYRGEVYSLARYAGVKTKETGAHERALHSRLLRS